MPTGLAGREGGGGRRNGKEVGEGGEEKEDGGK